MPTETPRKRILWLAVAEGRGHLMRAHLMRKNHPDIDIITTSEAGVRFLAGLGTPSRVFTRGFRMRYDRAQNLLRARTAGQALGYLTTRYPHEVRTLGRWIEDYDLFLNDFHILGLCAPWTHPELAHKVVHVHGTHLWGAITRPLEGTPLAWLNPALARPLEALRGRARAQIVHDPRAALDRAERHARTWRLPPLTATPTRTPSSVRDALSVPHDAKLVTAYLNPYVRDVRVAEEIERAARAHGATLYGVSEAFAGRPGWVARDGALVDKIAASDALVSAPGMAAVGLVRELRRPFLMLLSDQPEQRANARDLLSLSDRPPIASADMGAALTQELGALLDQPQEPARAHRASALWTRTLEAL